MQRQGFQIGSSDGSRERRWRAVALRCLALLVVPLVAWLAFAPSASSRRPPPARGRDEASGEGPTSTATTPPAHAQPAPTTADEPARGASDAVEGDVVDPSGQPAAHASVTCTIGERELEAFTDDAGHFRLGADAVGCGAVAHTKHFGPSKEEALRAGATNRLRLEPPTGIAGVVVDEGGAPIIRYKLSAASFEPAGGAKDGGAARTPRNIDVDDGDGAFEWTELSAGRYTLGVGVGLGALGQSEPIEVAPGAMIRGVRVVVRPGVTVTGKITDAVTHAPIDGARAFVSLGGLLARSGPSRNGEFKIDGAPAGRFDLHVYRIGYAEQITRDLQGGAGATPLHVDVALRRDGDATPPSDR